MRRLLRVLILPSFLFATVSAASGGPPTVLRSYQVESPYGFSEGCFDLCACPIWASENLTGGFNLAWRGFEDGFAVFDVRDVEWTAEFFDGVSWPITGQGTFRTRRGHPPVQRLELDLTFDGRTEHFDSGLIEAPVRFPALDISVNMNQLVCYDVVFRVVAKPRTRFRSLSSLTGELPKSPPTTFGSVKARFK